jgi:hypothetical protein
MKYLFTCIIFLFSFKAYSQVNVIVQWQPVTAREASDTIYYDTAYHLAWKDFKGPPDSKSIAGAITSSGFGFTSYMRTSGKHTDIIITVYCFFDKNKSWVRHNMKTSYALLHEQHHFDITYLNACGFFKRIKSTNFTRNNYQALLEKIDNEAYDAMEKMQNDYDGQTKNGQLKDVQAEWNEKIDRLLSIQSIN